jgi:hypothetical protein
VASRRAAGLVARGQVQRAQWIVTWRRLTDVTSFAGIVSHRSCWAADGRSAVEVIVDAEGHADALDAGRLEVADRGLRQLHVEQTLLAGGDARAGEAGDGDLRRPAFAARAMPRRLPRAVTGMCM